METRPNHNYLQLIQCAPVDFCYNWGTPVIIKIMAESEKYVGQKHIWQCPGGEILPIRIKLVILRNNSVSLVECRVINSGSEIPCHKLASISTKFRVINFMTRDSRHGIKILWKFSKKSLHRGFWGEKIKLSKNPCMGTLRGHIRRCSCKGDNFF